MTPEQEIVLKVWSSCSKLLYKAMVCFDKEPTKANDKAVKVARWFERKAFKQCFKVGLHKVPF